MAKLGEGLHEGDLHVYLITFKSGAQSVKFSTRNAVQLAQSVSKARAANSDVEWQDEEGEPGGFSIASEIADVNEIALDENGAPIIPGVTTFAPEPDSVGGPS